jgi:hypothetical protein
MVIGLEGLEEATDGEGESSWVKLIIPCLRDWANERRLWSLGVSMSAVVLLPPLLPLPLMPLVDAMAEKVVAAAAVLDQAVDVGVVSGGAGGRAVLTAIVVAESDDGEAGDDDAMLESGGKLGSAVLLSLLLSRGLLLLWSVLS